MNIIQLAQIVSESIAAVGIVAAGLGYFWGQVAAGKNKATKEDYQLLTTRIDALQKLCDQQQLDLNQLHQDLGAVRAEKENLILKIKELTSIIENRDPALAEYMAFVRQAINDFKDDFKKMLPILIKMEHFLETNVERRS